MATGLTDFVMAKRHKSYLAHSSCPIAESQKLELLVAPGTDSLLFNQSLLEKVVCSDRILTCRIKSIRSPAKVGLVVTDLITSPVVSWEGWETPPPSTEAQLSFFAQPPAW